VNVHTSQILPLPTDASSPPSSSRLCFDRFLYPWEHLGTCPTSHGSGSVDASSTHPCVSTPSSPRPCFSTHQSTCTHHRYFRDPPTRRLHRRLHAPASTASSAPGVDWAYSAYRASARDMRRPRMSQTALPGEGAASSRAWRRRRRLCFSRRSRGVETTEETSGNPPGPGRHCPWGAVHAPASAASSAPASPASSASGHPLPLPLGVSRRVSRLPLGCRPRPCFSHFVHSRRRLRHGVWPCLGACV
jgi:hypothetical protein